MTGTKRLAFGRLGLPGTSFGRLALALAVLGPVLIIGIGWLGIVLGVNLGTTNEYHALNSVGWFVTVMVTVIAVVLWTDLLWGREDSAAVGVATVLYSILLIMLVPLAIDAATGAPLL
ncbi:hypothetical protein [Arthrobacter sp. NicSoilB8]|uniref:hypothetical protein n=1 Tax=Arthrobacter sp. NicSoilB8 TaxID=2830998 RepID=UPI001CC80C6D|nr:hypothetical protein [Arthrobacter sp. NicSoilB8]BCW71726.1 hypothetical protein NicSoilB8_27700 [Arthrobacter sp. NicSoilB8]